MEQFIKNFADQFDDTELEEFKPETVYRDIDEWSSLTGLAVLNMIDKKYGVSLSITDFTAAETVQALYELVQSKR